MRVTSLGRCLNQALVQRKASERGVDGFGFSAGTNHMYYGGIANRMRTDANALLACATTAQ